MKDDYRILIHTTPNTHDNPAKPYFWCILKDGKANAGCGWSTSPTAAFVDAMDYLKKI